MCTHASPEESVVFRTFHAAWHGSCSLMDRNEQARSFGWWLVLAGAQRAQRHAEQICAGTERSSGDLLTREKQGHG